MTVTFLAPAPPGQEPRVADPAELTEVGWWTTDQAAADPRCPLTGFRPLLDRADQSDRRSACHRTRSRTVSGRLSSLSSSSGVRSPATSVIT